MNTLVPRDSGGPGTTLREWSSLIGIVTAIVGNILISFALNIQRYAHTRLGREQDRERELANGLHKRGTQQSYGTQQNSVAEERARLNLTASRDDSLPQDMPPDNLNTPRMMIRPQPSMTSVTSHGSSDSTIKPSEKLQPSTDKKTYLRSPYWWGGIILMTIGEAGNFLAYGFAPASIVSPLGVVALVSNCIIAPCLLKERFRQRDFWGVMIAIAGAVTIVLSAEHSENKLGPDDVWAAITRWEFELYLGITIGLIIALMWASGKYGEKTILIDLGLVGLFGGYTALSTKGVASLLSDTLWRTLTFPVTYLLIFILVGTALMQIRYINRALQRFDSTQVIPVQFVLFTLSVIVGSAILFRDFKSANGDRIGEFIGGCCLTFLGVYLITSGRGGGERDDEGPSLEDEENAIGLIDEERYEDELVVDVNNRRKHSVSTKINDADGAADSKKSSMQATALAEASLHAPRRTPTRTSSASSRNSNPTQENDSPLPTTSWRHSAGEPTPLDRPQVGETSISSPLLPSEAQRSGSSTPLTGRPGKPPNLSRSSRARLRPGPLMSPLSSSLSAVVADERRRAADSTPSRRRPRVSGLRKRSSKNLPAADLGLGASPLKASQLPEQAIEDERPPTVGRSQSVSAAIEGLFRLKRGSV